MMDWTDTHCRVLHRLLTRHAVLYTEMVTAEAVLRGNRTRLLGFDPSEHPVALQLGGSDAAKLAEASKIAADMGYDEINLNVGCPSDRVQSGRFGACLMREPELVADCVAAMRAAVDVPVTVKCRLGVDDQEPEESLRAMIAGCAAAGVSTFAVHARKAWLDGLSPKENRDVPPLDYDLVYRVKRENPDLTIVLNGGIANLDEAEAHLAQVDGVMLGRAAYHTPAMLAEVDARFFGGATRDIDEAVQDYIAYVARKLREGVPLNAMTKHMLGLFNGKPGARLFRRHLSENATRRGAAMRGAARCAGVSEPCGDGRGLNDNVLERAVPGAPAQEQIGPGRGGLALDQAQAEAVAAFLEDVQLAGDAGGAQGGEQRQAVLRIDFLVVGGEQHEGRRRAVARDMALRRIGLLLRFVGVLAPSSFSRLPAWARWAGSSLITGYIRPAKSGRASSASVLSTCAYTAASKRVMSEAATWPPAEKPSTPTRLGSMAKSFARARMRRMARCASWSGTSAFAQPSAGRR